MKSIRVVILVLLIIFIDQALKIWIKTHLMLGQEIVMADWFRLHFVENEGMAFGMVLPGAWGKILLSMFRLGAVCAGSWYIFHLIKTAAHWGFITACSMILAGAIGNMIDGTFYGMIFSDSYGRVASVFPPEGGYAGFMHGQVVDMLWFPMMHGVFPQWLPFWGGDYFEFFRPVFNIADSSISVGVALILIFQKKFFAEQAQPVTSESIPGEETNAVMAG